MRRAFRYSALAITLILGTCFVAPLATPKFLAQLGEFDFVKCETLMIRNKSKSVSIGISSEDGGGLVIHSSKGGGNTAVGISMGKKGYKIGITNDKGEDKVIIGVNNYGDGVVVLYDRNGNQTILGLPEPK